jgi:hypothetical protein
MKRSNVEMNKKYMPNILDSNMVTVEYENGKMRVVTNWLHPDDFAMLFVSKQAYMSEYKYSESVELIRKILGLKD